MDAECVRCSYEGAFPPPHRSSCHAPCVCTEKRERRETWRRKRRKKRKKRKTWRRKRRKRRKKRRRSEIVWNTPWTFDQSKIDQT